MNDRIPGTSWSNPIIYREKWLIYISTCASIAPDWAQWEWVHEDYDGAEDGHDTRCGHGKTADECKLQIDEWIEEHA